MEKYRSAVTIQSYSFQRMHRRICEAIRSTEKQNDRFKNHKEDVPQNSRYRQFRQPLWRLTFAPVIADKHKIWRKSRRSNNIIRSPFRKMGIEPTFTPGSPYSFSLSTRLRTRSKLPLLSRQPTRRLFSGLTDRTLAQTLVPLRRNKIYHAPLRSVTQDYSYLYETRSGKSSESSDLGLRSRLLPRTSAYVLPIVCNEKHVIPQASTRLAERMYNQYANRTMDADTSKQLGLQSRLTMHSSGYKFVQFEGSRGVQTSNSLLKNLRSARMAVNVSPVYVPKVLNTSIGRWSRPFLPNSPTGPGRTGLPFHKSRLDEVVTKKYMGLPQTSLHVRDSELASLYNPERTSSRDVTKQSCENHNILSIGLHRRCATRSEALPVSSSEIALRLRLSLRISSSGMSHLYPNKSLVSLPSKPVSKRNQKYSDDETEYKSKPFATTLSKYSTPSSSFAALPKRALATPSSKFILKPLPVPRRNASNYNHLYPSNPPKTPTTHFSLRPLPGTNVKLQTSRLRQPLTNINDFEEDLPSPISEKISSTRPLHSSANNYSQLYVSRPENLPSSELGQRLKLSLRSSTSKVTSLYASHPVDTTTPVTYHRKRSQLTRPISEKYSADAYVPRPGIVSSLRVRTNLHGML